MPLMPADIVSNQMKSPGGGSGLWLATDASSPPSSSESTLKSSGSALVIKGSSGPAMVPSSRCSSLIGASVGKKSEDPLRQLTLLRRAAWSLRPEPLWTSGVGGYCKRQKTGISCRGCHERFRLPSTKQLGVATLGPSVSRLESCHFGKASVSSAIFFSNFVV